MRNIQKKTISIVLACTLIIGLISGLLLKGKNEIIKADDSEMIEVSIVKIWDDYDNYDKIRPERIDVTLKQNEQEIETVTLSDANNWYYKYETPVARYDTNHEEIVYSWECDIPDGYTRYTDTLDQMTIITDCHLATNELIPPVVLEKKNTNGEYINNCKMQLQNIDKLDLSGIGTGSAEGDIEIEWISGDSNSIQGNYIFDDSIVPITGNDPLISYTMNDNGSLVINGLPVGEYIYKETEPKSGYATAESNRFKIEKTNAEYAYHWYTSFENAVLDANNLTMENADCYRDDEDAQAGLFIIDDTAYIIVLNDINDLNNLFFSEDCVIDFNEKILSMDEEKNITFAKDFRIADGTVRFEPCNSGSETFNCIYGTGVENALSIEDIDCEVASTGIPESMDYNSAGEVNMCTSDNQEITITDSELYVDIESLYTSSNMLVVTNEDSVVNLTGTNIEMVHGNKLKAVQSKGAQLNVEHCNFALHPQLFISGAYYNHVSCAIHTTNSEASLTVRNSDLSVTGENGDYNYFKMFNYLIWTADKNINVYDSVMHSDRCAMRGIFMNSYEGTAGGNINIIGNTFYNEVSNQEEFNGETFYFSNTSDAVSIGRKKNKDAVKTLIKNNIVNMPYYTYCGITVSSGTQSLEVENNHIVAAGGGFRLCASNDGVLNNNTFHGFTDDMHSNEVVGISIIGGSWTLDNNQVEAKGSGVNVGIINSGNVTINSGVCYAQPYVQGSDTDSYGSGIQNSGIMTINGDIDNLIVSGGNAGITCVRGSTTVINGGTYKSPNHGGIYALAGDTGLVQINGGLFYNNYGEYTSTAEGLEILGNIHSYGGAYFGANPIAPAPFSNESTNYSGDWTVYVSNATFIGGTWGICLKDSSSYVPPSVYLSNCRIKGNSADIFLQKNSTKSENTYAYICEGTVLEHEGTDQAILDQYAQRTGVPHVIDNR